MKKGRKQGSNKKGKCIIVLYFAYKHNVLQMAKYRTIIHSPFLLYPIALFQSYMPPTFSLRKFLLLVKYPITDFPQFGVLTDIGFKIRIST